MDAQFVQVGERQVLVRHAGRGPALVLLHQSPQSSAALQPLIERCAARYAVFAPDTPGFGQSSPLSLAQPTIPDFAQALAALLDALGLQRVLLYGVHTGASIAARFAQDLPQRVAGLVCDGLALFDDDERQPLLDGYLPPFEPAWDGTHLRWLWARIREQTLFFPWHQGTRAARLTGYAPARPEAVHEDVMALLDAGDGYRAGYRAPLLYGQGLAGVAQLAVPARLLYRRTDVLRPHLQRMPPLQPGVQAAEVADAEALQRDLLAFCDARSALACAADAAACVAAAVAPDRRRIATAGGALAWWGSGDSVAGESQPDRATARVLLPDFGTPARALTPGPGPGACWRVDWPGHGASAPRSDAALAAHALADDLLQAFDTLGLHTLTLQAHGGAGAIAAALAQRLGSRCRAVTLVDPLPLDAGEAACFLAGLPALRPVASGAHLLEAWDWARGRHLFWPWRPPTAEAAAAAPAPPPRRVHDEVVEMLRAGPSLHALWRTALAEPLAVRMRASGAAWRIEHGAHAERARLAARLVG